MSRIRRGYMLELFKGTGSVGRVFAANGFDVVSVDINAKWKPDIVTDVLKWDYKSVFRPGQFEYVWASPPCTEFSIALTTRPRNLRLGNRIVARALPGHAEHRPDGSVCPAFGDHPLPEPRLLVPREPGHRAAQGAAAGRGASRRAAGPPRAMRGLQFVDVDYCQFSDWGYRKRTRVWYGAPSAVPAHGGPGRRARPEERQAAAAHRQPAVHRPRLSQPCEARRPRRAPRAAGLHRLPVRQPRGEVPRPRQAGGLPDGAAQGSAGLAARNLQTEGGAFFLVV